jgi:hypothetical protein
MVVGGVLRVTVALLAIWRTNVVSRQVKYLYPIKGAPFYFVF